eukprot:scaffold78_cov265-Pinguiococcus_pyrenoidosus.AAC.2
MDRVKKSTCAAEMRRLMEAGPPIYVSDKHGLPLPEGDTHVAMLWYASDGEERSSKLEGAPEGAERDELWQSLKAFQGKALGSLRACLGLIVSVMSSRVPGVPDEGDGDEEQDEQAASQERQES